MLDPEKRLGAGGPEEVKNHPFFKDIDWDKLLTEPPSFVPNPTDAEDTDYFDARGATMQNLQVERARAIIQEQNPEKVTPLSDGKQTTDAYPLGDLSMTDDTEGTDFGTFVYKNLPLLEKANEDAIRRIRQDSIVATSSSSSSSIGNSAGASHGSGDASKLPHRSFPAISRKKRSSIFDTMHMLTVSSLPSTPHSLSPSTSSKVPSALSLTRRSTDVPVASLLATEAKDTAHTLGIVTGSCGRNAQADRGKQVSDSPG